ncbi:hypothetical protein J6O48_00400 [bacterium]|nr:hypothetical protein [bacterium]
MPDKSIDDKTSPLESVIYASEPEMSNDVSCSSTVLEHAKPELVTSFEREYNW